MLWHSKMRVRVYWNLHKKCWSVQCCKSNKVVLHANELTLTKCNFVVRKAGQKRVREERRKNVHAFVVGEITEAHPYRMPDNWRVSYNPFKNDTFMQGDDSILTATDVQLITSSMGNPEVYAMRGQYD